ncbi:MFS transporter [Streptomyces sp. NPDC059679]|uniref:MFS transporter n=1 Tax=Streptomyces sp. NPDC059679 TaxID=3346903 RepID=UPI0036A49F68
MSTAAVNESATAGTRPPKVQRQVLVALSGLLSALFVATLSSTVVSTALPRMIGALHGTQTQYTWVVTATLLSTTATTPIGGKLADLFSKKNLVQIATAAMIPPRERGQYSGYLSSVTAPSTIGGPLLGGLIVDTSWLGWRWCFFISLPVAVAALVLLSVALWVEARAAEPIVPLQIIRQRTTVLAILGSLAAGTAMFAASVYLSEYFQVSRGYTATRAGRLTIPMMGGILVSSILAGRLLSRTGNLKPFVIVGSVLLTAGFAGLGTIDHRTSLVFMSAAMLCIGLGVGMTMQNFVLAVQNSVPLKDIGTASTTVTFFRSLGGTFGVTVLGAVLARQVAERTAQGGESARVAYGDATGLVFLIGAAVAALGIVAAVLLKPVTLRTSLDSSEPADPKR